MNIGGPVQVGSGPGTTDNPGPIHPALDVPTLTVPDSPVLYAPPQLAPTLPTESGQSSPDLPTRTIQAGTCHADVPCQSIPSQPDSPPQFGAGLGRSDTPGPVSDTPLQPTAPRTTPTDHPYPYLVDGPGRVISRRAGRTTSNRTTPTLHTGPIRSAPTVQSTPAPTDKPSQSTPVHPSRTLHTPSRQAAPARADGPALAQPSLTDNPGRGNPSPTKPR